MGLFEKQSDLIQIVKDSSLIPEKRMKAIRKIKDRKTLLALAEYLPAIAEAIIPPDNR